MYFWRRSTRSGLSRMLTHDHRRSVILPRFGTAGLILPRFGIAYRASGPDLAEVPAAPRDAAGSGDPVESNAIVGGSSTSAAAELEGPVFFVSARRLRRVALSRYIRWS